MENEYAIDIHAPRNVVFEFFDNEDNIQQVVPNLVEAGYLERTPNKVGTTFWHVYEENGRKMKMTGVVSEYRPGECMAFQLDGPIFAMEVIYDFQELSADVTRIVQVSRVRLKHIFKLMGLLFGKKMQEQGLKVQEENFARIKASIESNVGG